MLDSDEPAPEMQFHFAPGRMNSEDADAGFTQYGFQKRFGICAVGGFTAGQRRVAQLYVSDSQKDRQTFFLPIAADNSRDWL